MKNNNNIKECICPHCGAVEINYNLYPDWIDYDADMIHRTYEITCWCCEKTYLYVEDYEIAMAYSEKI